MAFPFKPLEPRPDLDALLKKAAEHAAAMPPHDYLSMLALQHLSTTLAECVHGAQKSGKPETIEAMDRQLIRYERALDGAYSRELGLMAAGLLALLTQQDRIAMRTSIAHKRTLLAQAPVPS